MTDSVGVGDYSLSVQNQTLHFAARGEWSLRTIQALEPGLSSDISGLDYQSVHYDFADVTELDTAGAYILARAIRCSEDVCYPFEIKGYAKGQQVLMREAAEAAMGRPPLQTRQWFDTLVRMGEASERFIKEAYDTFAFLGRFFVVLVRQLLTPHTIRWKSVVAHVEDVGLNAAPVIMTLSFFVGAVIGYMAANILAAQGMQAFMVEFISIAVLREFAVIIMAILLAGRSDSAFTAQIGAMKMRQEIDAMEVIGLDRYEALVVPRALACLISAPILTFLAMVAGIMGGLFVTWLVVEGVSPNFFFARMQEVVEIKHFWVGLVKAPFFAILVAVIGCRQGLAVTGSVDSLGERTTKSVVQAIFAVIAVDAMFAVLFYQMGV